VVRTLEDLPVGGGGRPLQVGGVTRQLGGGGPAAARPWGVGQAQGLTAGTVTAGVGGVRGRCLLGGPWRALALCMAGWSAELHSTFTQVVRIDDCGVLDA